MKKTTSLLLFFFASICANCQSLLDSNRLLYSNIFAYNVPGDILADIVGHSNHLQHFNGDDKDSFSTVQDFRRILLDLKSCAFDMSTFPTVREFSTIVSQYRDSGIIPLAIIDYEIGILEDTFYTGPAHYDSVNHKILFDSSMSKYISSLQVFAFCALAPINVPNPKFVLAEELIFTNKSSTYWLTFGSDNNRMKLITDSIFSMDFSSLFGELTYQLMGVELHTIDASDSLFAKTQIALIEEAEADFSSYVSDLNPDPCISFLPKDINEARIYIKYGKAQSATKKLKKPFILVEGFDFDLNPNDDRYGDISFTSIIKGISISELTGQSIKSNLKDMETFSKRLYDNNYDLIFVDFKDGSADLFKNGNTLIKIIQWVNQNKQGEEEIVVFGASMGGLLARYALRNMEINNCNHCCKLYGTFDSPHKGANAPLSLQYAIEFMTANNLDTEYGWLALNSQAAKQMLIHNIAVGAQTARKRWQTWLDTYGQPETPKRIAISNGNPNGGGPFPEGITLYHECFRTANVELFKMLMFAGKAEQLALWLKIPKGKSSFAKYINAGWGKPNEQLLYFPANQQYYDHVSGGQASWVAEANEIVQAYLSQYKNNKCHAFVMNNGGQSTFIPTYSALDFNQELFFPNLVSLFPKTPIDKTRENSSLHPFHSIYYHSSINPQHQNNQVHVFVDKAKGQNIDWIFEELESLSHGLKEVLPLSSNQSTYNYNRHANFENPVPNLRISNGGKLHLNGNQKINYGSNSDHSPLHSGDLQKFRTLLCGSLITIENGGELELGTALTAGNHKAIFRIVNGSILSLRSNSLLVINEGSTLIVEEGAELQFEGNAKIILGGPNAKLWIKGILYVGANTEFSLSKYSNEKYGQLILEHTSHNQGTPLIPNGSNASIFLSGNGVSSPTNLILKTAELLIPKEFQNVTLENISVFCEDKTKLNIHSKCSLQNVSFISENHKGSGLITHGQSSQFLKNVVFKSLSTGLEFDALYSNNHPTLQSCSFNDCLEGLFVSGGQTMLQDCNFFDCELACFALSVYDISLNNCLFKQNISAIYSHTSTTSNLNLKQSIFTSNTKALTIENTIASLSCTQFQWNTTAIDLLNSSLIMSALNPSGIDDAGNNSFSYNLGCIEGSGELYIERGNNNFIKSNTSVQPFINLLVPQNSACLSSPNTIEAAVNYWNPKPPAGQLINGGSQFYQLSIQNFPHPVLGYLEGSILAKENTLCYVSDNHSDGEPVPENQSSSNNSNSDDELEVHVYPNPTEGIVNIYIESAKVETVNIKLYNLAGEIVLEQVLNIMPDTNNYVLGLEPLLVGSYLMELTMNQDVIYKKLIVK